ncbi:hypothetical protein [Auritidibacter ignavus]|uniref:hypothetical protein n=1 Tax=Auritidibacter ignavus TaxID=678932 RepID=UPI00244AF986|nr:hypothetical protein [Auritidibacter ignavus]WGH86018.1 hypothetical protein QDX24_10695 [Auritidibacter ignavus]WGH88304.1 hypothetical protein QDX22_10695 [Auritidibacter ignavus]
MPEGDTLFHLAGQLDPLLRGQIITDSDVRTKRYATAELTGSRITGVRSVGIALLDQSILAGIGNITGARCCLWPGWLHILPPVIVIRSCWARWWI